MPDPLLYLRATGVAAAITLTMAILLRRWPRGSTSGRRVLLLLGAAGAVVAGWAVLGIRPSDIRFAAKGEKGDPDVGVITTDNYVEEGFLDDSSPTVNKGFPNCRKLGSLVVQGQAGVN